MAEPGISAAWRRGWASSAVNEDARENMSSIFHPRHFQMGCSIFRCSEPVEWREMAELLSVLGTGSCPGLGGKARARRACLILFCLICGDSNT